VNEIKSAGFGREHISAIEFAERERPPAERIAHGDELALTHDDK
jgi:hypothetical protein